MRMWMFLHSHNQDPVKGYEGNKSTEFTLYVNLFMNINIFDGVK